MEILFPSKVVGHHHEINATELTKHGTPLPPATHKPSDIDDLTDAQILELETLARHVPTAGFSADVIGVNNVTKITDNAVLKFTFDADKKAAYPAEALAQQLIFEQTSIPVPQIYRVFGRKHAIRIAMEYVPGEQLCSVWPRLSWLARLRVAITLRSYVQQLRQVRHPERETIPGPLGMPGERGLAGMSSMWPPSSPNRGPFHSYADFTKFFNKRIQFYQGMPMPQLVGKMDDSEPLVLTHQDINSRNILVGEDGRLWLIDFGLTGFYPPWVEFVNMRIQFDNERMRGEELEGWDTMIPFICGWYRDQDEWYKLIQASLYWRY